MSFIKLRRLARINKERTRENLDIINMTRSELSIDQARTKEMH
jgi:hypothetical protein